MKCTNQKQPNSLVIFADAFEQIPEENRIKVIENWIASGDIYGLPEDAQVLEVTRLVIDEVMSPELDASQTVVTILPEASKNAINKFQSNYTSFGVTIENEGQISVPIASYLNHKNREFPMMVANFENKTVQLGWDGRNISRTASDVDKNEINKSLEQFESFIQSVDFAEPEFPDLAKTSVAGGCNLHFIQSFSSHVHEAKERDLWNYRRTWT